MHRERLHHQRDIKDVPQRKASNRDLPHFPGPPERACEPCTRQTSLLRNVRPIGGFERCLIETGTGLSIPTVLPAVA
jgi:hypothetical protein